MCDINQILVPIDFHQHTDKIIKYALSVAKKFSATVKFLHVVDQGGHYAGIVHPSWEKISKELQAQAEEKMSNLIEDLSGDCSSCTGQVMGGDVVDAIVECAADDKTDLIIIGTHGAKGLEKILFGSVAERVVKNAPCSALCYRPTD